MADGPRFPSPAAGNYHLVQNTQSPHSRPRKPQSSHSRQYLLRPSTPPSIRSVFNQDTPSPSRSPDSRSLAQDPYAMYPNQNHQQGHHGRANGGAGRGNLPMAGLFHYQPHPQAHQPQHAQHPQHHQNIQDHNAHNMNGNVMGHHQTYSSGPLQVSHATPTFTPGGLQNGHPSTTQGGSAQVINEHWAEQLKLRGEAEKAHKSMSSSGKGHHFARSVPVLYGAFENSAAADPSTTEDDDTERRNRPSNRDFGRRQDWHNMDLSGQGLRTMSAGVCNYEFLAELFLSSNRLKSLPPAIGKLRSLRHLDVSYNQLTELPPELGMCVYLKQLLLFENQITILPSDLGSLYHLEVLGIEGNPLSEDQKTELVEKGTKSLILTLRENAPVPLPPNPRPMIDLLDGAVSASNQERFKVFSYNILCDYYVNAESYGYVPSLALSWDYRKDQILREIQSSEADFVCLQEVDVDSYNEFFRPKLAYDGYKGAFWPKTRARTMHHEQSVKVDGCATLHKDSKYILLDKQVVEFQNIAINRPDMKNQTDCFNRIMPRDHVAVVTFYENRQTGSRVVVANAHIFWDPVFADVKLIQMALLMEQLSKLTEKYTKFAACKDKKVYAIKDDSLDTETEEPIEQAPSQEYTSQTQLPLIVCGDLNSMHDSSVYELLATGRVDPTHKDLAGHTYGNFTRDGIDHPFSLRTAYGNLDGTADEVKFTNYVPSFCGHIDHIWYSTNALENTALLGPVDEEYMKTVPGLPHFHFPSDHIALVAEFSVRGRKEKKLLDPDAAPSGTSRR